jgi:hypothetical protein
MCDTLYAELSKVYDGEEGDFRLRPLMRFHGRKKINPKSQGSGKKDRFSS